MELKHKSHPWIEERRLSDPHRKKFEEQSLNQRLAVAISTGFGSMATFYLLIIWIISWVILASVGFSYFKSDPYPFNFLLFLCNVIQLLSLPILAVGQQALSRSSDKLALQTFKDAEAILSLQNEVHRLIEINNLLTTEIHSQIVKAKPGKK